MLISLISFVIVFSFIALSHELGHFIWAKRAGIRVFEFGVGFGPRLFAFEKNGTTFSLCLIPILAFVRIAGEGDSDEDRACPESERFQSKTIWQRAQALAAGPLVNIAAAFVLLTVLFTFAGVPSRPSNEIGAVNKNSVAEKAGLKVGDLLVSINGKKYPDMTAAIEFIHANGGKNLTLVVRRGSQQLAINATPKFNPKMKIALLGFSPKPIYRPVNLLQAVYHGATQTYSMVAQTLLVVWLLVRGGVSIGDLAGPIGIAQITGQYAQTGLISLIYFTAFISVNIGVLNLLPLPALDGGRLVFVLLEWVRRKPVNPDLENKVHQWGLIALLALMAVVSVGDIMRLFRK